MTTQARIILPGEPHHVSQRGNRKENIFFDDSDRIFYLQLLKHYCAKHNSSLLCYCLMDNHYHLVIIPSCEDSIHLIFKSLNMLHSKRINKKNNWCGHLWQGRPWSEPMNADGFYNQIRYILNNPVRAGMCEEPVDYKWSCAKYYYQANADLYLSVPKEWRAYIQNIRPWLSNDFSSLLEHNKLTSTLQQDGGVQDGGTEDGGNHTAFVSSSSCK